uniref:Uncharacterized protein n=1 Tax=Trieres chinensis TaxID=1514140 RepID=A0A6U1TPE4_TRICV|mmetsp:Transcript_16198/g.33252  ORF Transcript_16198/g.33252 Transcript_16198/m.33252 type:complete len:216 (+) Transcript_16198:30-677(+)
MTIASVVPSPSVASSSLETDDRIQAPAAFFIRDRPVWDGTLQQETFHCEDLSFAIPPASDCDGENDDDTGSYASALSDVDLADAMEGGLLATSSSEVRRRVRFPANPVSDVLYRPRTDPDDVSDLFYRPEDFRRFKREYCDFLRARRRAQQLQQQAARRSVRMSSPLTALVRSAAEAAVTILASGASDVLARAEREYGKREGQDTSALVDTLYLF